jgi:predicted metalloprotease with PDZ domain
LRLQLRRAVLHTASLSLRPHLERLGFRVEKERVSQFGLILKHSRVQEALDSGQAGRAGIAPGDRILAIDGFAFSSAGLDWVAKRGAQAEWEVLRGHRLLRFRLTAEKTAQLGTMTWTGNEEQARRIREWLRAEFRPRPEEKFERDFRENFHGEETVV